MNTYIQLTEVEDSFRIEKHGLWMRPIFHQKEERTQAHILVCLLALSMCENPTAMDEGIGTRYSSKKIDGGVAGIEIARHASPATGENPQTKDGGNSANGSQDTASGNEDSAPQQTQGYRKCSDENSLILIVTT